MQVELDSAQARRLLESISRARSRAKTATLNAVAFSLQRHMRWQMGQVFDRVTPYMVRSVRVNKAGATSPVAEVGFFHSSGKSVIRAIAHHTTGGQRRFKGFEGLLGGRDLIATGDQAAPTQSSRRNAHGNMSPSTIRTMIGGIKKPKDGGRFFAIRDDSSNLPAGIYRRTGGKARHISMVMRFIDRSSYRKRLDLEQMANYVISRDSESEYANALQRALGNIRL